MKTSTPNTAREPRAKHPVSKDPAFLADPDDKSCRELAVSCRLDADTTENIAL
ncbi:hypothetical protein [Acidisphaera sp. S103]|uniref:hypothetical protein n=1 Tax=Acidisphaera sp. S103 TaxID=1747223 RepID=UPI00131EC6C3|nr:hypothetical protein [Acidisphaera sp. S103]